MAKYLVYSTGDGGSGIGSAIRDSDSSTDLLIDDIATAKYFRRAASSIVGTTYSTLTTSFDLDTTHTPVGLWKLNGSLTDSSLNANTLTVTGTTMYGEVGPGLLGFAFDAASVLAVSAAETELLLIGNMTIQAVVNVNVPPASGANYVIASCSATNGAVDGYEDGYNNILYSLGIKSQSAGPIGVCEIFSTWEHGATNNSPTNVTWNSGYYITPGTPVHLALTRASSGGNVVLKLYVNGVLRSTSSSLQGPDNPYVSGTPQQRFRIGALADSTTSSYFNGLISNVKIVDSTLTDQNIADEYARYNGTYNA